VAYEGSVWPIYKGGIGLRSSKGLKCFSDFIKRLVYKVKHSMYYSSNVCILCRTFVYSLTHMLKACSDGYKGE
jgi:hypothetical protein